MKKVALFFAVCFTLNAPVIAAVPQNSRSASSSIAAPRVERATAVATANRAATTPVRQTQSRSATPSRSAKMPAISGVRSATTPAGVSRSATPSRSAKMPVISGARSATTPAGVSRSATLARAATPVFSDLSKMGTGYNTCREAYNTCMDQFCAAASDTYRRCICSDKYMELADMESALSQAKIMLQNFSDNNLANVGLTAQEVGAMTTATAGELAAGTDTSAAAQALEEIGDLLSGRAKPAQTTSRLDFSNLLDFSSAMEDIWSGGDGLFGASTTDLSTLTGVELYNEVNNQCGQLSADSCDTSATMQMVRSAYNLTISQDCQAYERALNKPKEEVAEKLRQANNMLRDARLEEYRSHNSATMNQCIASVRRDILDDSACGADYRLCLDFTGMYINVSDGSPIYSTRLFELTNQIKLENPNAPENRVFLAGLDNYKNRATASLDSCRDDATAVWDAFKRQALIEISQAQDRKLQEVKDTCVMTMKDCYDTTTGALNSFDDTTSQRTGALSARASAAMCKDQVVACAALYTPAGGVQCQFDGNNRITNADRCGLRELMDFVGVVDSVRIAEGCDSALESYIADTCAPVAGDVISAAPYGCRLISRAQLLGGMQTYARTFCLGGDSATTLDGQTAAAVQRVVDDAAGSMEVQLSGLCAEFGGIWVSDYSEIRHMGTIELEPTFATQVYGGLSNIRTMVGGGLNLAMGRSARMPTGAQGVTTRSAVRATEYVGGQVQQQQVQQQQQMVSGGVLTAGTTGAATAEGLRPDSQAAVAAGGVNAQNLSVPDLGWGLCLVNNEMLACNLQNEATGNAGHASWNGTSCVFSADFARLRCEMLGGGTWLAQQRECWVFR